MFENLFLHNSHSVTAFDCQSSFTINLKYSGPTHLSDPAANLFFSTVSLTFWGKVHHLTKASNSKLIPNGMLSSYIAKNILISQHSYTWAVKLS